MEPSKAEAMGATNEGIAVVSVDANRTVAILFAVIRALRRINHNCYSFVNHRRVMVAYPQCGSIGR